MQVLPCVGAGEAQPPVRGLRSYFALRIIITRRPSNRRGGGMEWSCSSDWLPAFTDRLQGGYIQSANTVRSLRRPVHPSTLSHPVYNFCRHNELSSHLPECSRRSFCGQSQP